MSTEIEKYLLISLGADRRLLKLGFHSKRSCGPRSTWYNTRYIFVLSKFRAPYNPKNMKRIVESIGTALAAHRHSFRAAVVLTDE